MKLLKHVKSLTVAMLAIAFACIAFGATKAHADADPTPTPVPTVKVTFTATVDGVAYSYEVEASKGTVKLAEVLAGLTDKTKGDLNAKGEYFIFEIEDVEDLANITFSKTEAKAFTVYADKLKMYYDPEADVITTEQEIPIGTVIYTASGKEATTEIKKAGYTLTVASGSAVSISLSDKNKGYKIGEDKDVFLYIGTRAPSKDDVATPNFALKGTAIKKLDVAFDYSKAYAGSDAAVVTVKDVTTKDTPVPIDSFKVAYMSTETKAKKSSDWSYVAIKNKETSEVTVSLTGGEFYNFVKLDKNKKYKLTFKVVGEAYGEPNKDGYNGVRGSKVKTVAVAQEAKAPKIKVDYVKGTIAIKNGFDYGVDTTSGAAIQTTILPYNKSEKAAKSATVDFDAFTPVAKFAEDNATALANFTQKKVGSMTLEAICAETWKTGNAFIVVRKSATAKKPASETSVVEVAAPASGPAVTPTEGLLGSTKYTLDKDKKADKTKKVEVKAGQTADCEYFVVKKSDIASIDWSTAKWSKLAKGKGIPSTVKCNYKLSGNKVDADALDNADVVILLRTAGVKGKGTKAGTLPSENITTKLVTSSDGLSVEWKVE